MTARQQHAISNWWILKSSSDENSEDGSFLDSPLGRSRFSLKVFDPASRWMVAWNCLIAILVVEVIFTPAHLKNLEGEIVCCWEQVSFQVAFISSMNSKKSTSGQNSSDFDPGVIYSNLAIDCMFLIDVLIQFNTAFFMVDEQGNSVLVEDRWQICLNYGRYYFLIDFFTSIPVDFIVLQTKGQSSTLTQGIAVLRIFRFFKLFRAWRVGQFIGKIFRRFDINPAIILGIKMFSGFFVVTHGLSCLSFYIGTLTDSFKVCDDAHECNDFTSSDSCNMLRWGRPVCPCRPGNETPWCRSRTWLTETYFMLPSNRSVRAMDADIANQYWITIYWVITTMATIGFGDIKPQTQYEIWTCILCQIIGAAAFGFIVGNMTNVAQLLNGQKEKLTGEIDELNHVLRDFKAPRSLQVQATQLVRHHFHKPLRSIKRDIIDRVPTWMAVDVAKEVFKSVLHRCCLFKSSRPHTLHKLYLRLQPVTLVSGECLFRSEDRSNAIIFILNGVVDVVDESRKSVSDWEGIPFEHEHSGAVASLFPGGFLGENCMLNERNHFPFTARTVTICDLLYLPASDVVLAYEDCPVDLAKVQTRCKLRYDRFLCLIDLTRTLHDKEGNSAHLLCPNPSRDQDASRTAQSEFEENNVMPMSNIDKRANVGNENPGNFTVRSQKITDLRDSSEQGQTLLGAQMETHNEKEDAEVTATPGLRAEGADQYRVSFHQFQGEEISLEARECLSTFSKVREGVDIEICDFLGNIAVDADAEALEALGCDGTGVEEGARFPAEQSEPGGKTGGFLEDVGLIRQDDIKQSSALIERRLLRMSKKIGEMEKHA